MTWVRLDDKLPRHPKVMTLGRLRYAALGLHVEALCYASEYLTDGVLAALMVRKMPKPLVEALLKAGLWHRLGDGDVQIHDYLEYNPSREVVQGKRDAARTRMSGTRSREHSANFATGSQEPAASRAHVSRPVPVPSPTPDTPPTPEESAKDPVVVYANLAGGYPSSKAMDWIDQLSGEYGSVAVIQAFGKARGPAGKLIGAAQDILRAEARELSLREKDVERAKVAERRNDGMQKRRLEYLAETGKWPAEWGERPAAA